MVLLQILVEFAGLYTVTVEDFNGCLEYERYVRVLEATSPLEIDSTEVLNVLCFGEETAQVKAVFFWGLRTLLHSINTFKWKCY